MASSSGSISMRGFFPCARPIYDGNEISSLPISVLNSELRCPVCLNLLRQPVATECMHRFCASCIQKCLRLGKKECPSCRKPIATRRNLRNDNNFATLIAKLYPDLEDFEVEEDEELSSAAATAQLVATAQKRQSDMIERQRANGPPSYSYYSSQKRRRLDQREEGSEGEGSGTEDGSSEGEGESDEEGEEEAGEEDAAGGAEEEDAGEEEQRAAPPQHKRQPQQQPPQRSAPQQPKTRPQAPPQPREPPRTPQTPPLLTARPNEVAFLLSRHPLEGSQPELRRDMITVASIAQIHQVQKYLAMKLGLGEGKWQAFQIIAKLPNKQHQVLPHNWSLQAVLSNHNLGADSLELLWRYDNSNVSAF